MSTEYMSDGGAEQNPGAGEPGKEPSVGVPTPTPESLTPESPAPVSPAESPEAAALKQQVAELKTRLDTETAARAQAEAQAAEDRRQAELRFNQLVAANKELTDRLEALRKTQTERVAAGLPQSARLGTELAVLLREQGEESVKDRVEELLRSEEDSPQGFTTEHINSVLLGISEGLSGKLAQELRIKVYARYKYADADYAARNIGGEEYAKKLVSIQKEEHEEILNTPGVKYVLGIIEKNNLQKDQEKEIQKALVEIVKKNKTGIEIANMTDDELKHRVDRAIDLAKKMCNIFGVSARNDGPVLKAEYGGGMVKLSNVIVRFDGGEYDLTALRADDDVWKKIREAEPQLFAEAWDKAWREFFRDRWGEIDFSKSFKNKGASSLRKEFYFPITLEQPGYLSGNLYRGRAEYLRRFTYVGVQDLLRTTGRSSIEEQVAQWSEDESLYRAWAKKVDRADKVRKMFTEDGPRFLDNPAAINNPDLKEFGSIIEAMGSYMSQQEQRDHAAYLIEGVGRFIRTDNSKVFNYRNASDDIVDNYVRRAESLNYIDRNNRKEVERRLFGPRLLGFIKYHGSKLDFMGFFWELIKGIFKAGFSAK